MRKKVRVRSFALVILVLLSFFASTVYAVDIPKEAKIHNQLGNEYCDKGDFNKAVEEYEKAVNIFPHYSDAIYNLCMTYYLDLKNPVKAGFFMKRFLQLETDTADAEQVKKWLVAMEEKSVAARESKEAEQTEQPKGTEEVREAKVEDKPQAEKTALLPPGLKKEAIIDQELREENVPADQEVKEEVAVMPPVEEAPVRKEKKGSLPEKMALQTAATAKSGEVKPKMEASLEEKKSQESVKEATQTQSPNREKAVELKNKGNEYNQSRQPAEAVKYYLQALDLAPDYTDALYNIAKTYDFDLKDYPKAAQYYKRFLDHEPSSSSDATQVRIWLARVEKAALEQKKEEPPKEEVAQQQLAKKEAPPTQTLAPKKQGNSLPAKEVKAVKVADQKPVEVQESPADKNEEKVAGYYTKSLLSGPAKGKAQPPASKKATPVASIPKAEVASLPKESPKASRPEVQSKPEEPKPEERKPEEPKSEESNLEAQALPSEPKPEAPPVSETPVLAAQTLPAESKAEVQPVAEEPSPKPLLSETQPEIQNLAGQDIIIETIIPQKLVGSKWVTLGMQRMQEEVVNILKENKATSPDKLAEIYLSRIQSSILPSGEKVSSFRIEEKDLADLPYLVMLTEEEKRDLEKEKWDLIRTRKSPNRLKEVLDHLRNGYKITPH